MRHVSYTASLHTFLKYPGKLKTRVKEIYELLSKIMGCKFTPNPCKPTKVDEKFYLSKDIVYLSKYTKSDNLTTFRLNNKMLQILGSNGVEITANQDTLDIYVVTTQNEFKQVNVKQNYADYFYIGRDDEPLSKMLLKGKDIIERY